MAKYLLIHDLGTTGNKACLFDENAELVAMTYHPYKSYYPKPGYQEQCPEDWWEAVCISTKKIISTKNISPENIACISFSGHMMGCVPLDRSGNLLRKLVPIYADSRAGKQANYIMDKIGGYERWYMLTGTGQLPDSYSISKHLWMKENEREIYKNVYKFLNTKDYIIYKLTGQFATDYSDASDMGLLDINTREWSKEILNIAGISKDKLPEIHESTDVIGQITESAAKEIGIRSGTPVVMGGGDVSCAATGAGMNKNGLYYMSIGSANWVGTYIDTPMLDNGTKPSCFSHLIPGKYVLHQFMIGGGICYQWIGDNILEFEQETASKININPYKYMDILAEGIKPGADNLLFLPYMRGDWSGRYNPNARGAFIGLSLRHTKAHMVRAVLEGVGFSLRILLEMLEKQSIIADEIRVIGGGSRSQVWRQIIADICNTPITRPSLTQETGSLGVAITAGIGIGIFKDYSILDEIVKIIDTRDPQEKNRKLYDDMYTVYKESYQALTPVFDCLVEI